MRTLHSLPQSFPFVIALFAAGACGGSPEAPRPEERAVSAAEHLDLRTNMALNRPTTQSSTASGADASRAVDGNTDGDFTHGSVTQTNVDPYAWWQVDLGRSQWVETLEIFNRTDCCSDRLNNFWVFMKDTPFIASTSPDLIQEDGVTAHAVFGTPDNPDAIPISRYTRYIRIQLSGAGTLSLAEVRAWGRTLTYASPDNLATQIGWTPTGITTDETALAAFEAEGTVYALHRGADGLLHIAANVDAGTSVPVPGSPALTTDGISAVYDGKSKKLFVAMQAQSGGFKVVEATFADGAFGGWTWADFGVANAYVQRTTLKPALTVGCDKVYVSALFPWAGGAMTLSRPLAGGAWGLDGKNLGLQTTPPALATNARGDVALAAVSKDDHKVHYSQFMCSTKTWTPPVTLNSGAQFPLDRTSADGHVSLTSVGTQFAVAIRGDGNQALFMMQLGLDSAPLWPQYFEPIAVDATSMMVEEAPTLTTFRGIIIAGARNTSNTSFYAVRNPNKLGTMPSGLQKSVWMGNRVIGGAGTAATPPVFVAAGASVDSGRADVHQELFALTRGINDRQIYGLNMARFMAVDILTNVNGVQFDTLHEAEGIPPQNIPNIFDELQVFLFAPWSVSQTLTHPCNGNMPLTIMADTHYIGGQTYETCRAYDLNASLHIPGPMMRLSGRNNGWGASALMLWGEWGHMTAWTSLEDQQFHDTFGGYKLQPRACNTDADCGGAHCGLGKEAGADGFDDPEPVAWVNKKACLVPEATGGFRLQGFVRSFSGSGFYDITSDEHNYLYFAEAYRWHGDWLRQAVAKDAAAGNHFLEEKYAFVKNTYEGVEFNGWLNNQDDESLGGHAVPIAGTIVAPPPAGR